MVLCSHPSSNFGDYFSVSILSPSTVPQRCGSLWTPALDLLIQKVPVSVHILDLFVKNLYLIFCNLWDVCVFVCIHCLGTSCVWWVQPFIIHIQGVPGGMCNTSGECSLC